MYRVVEFECQHGHGSSGGHSPAPGRLETGYAAVQGQFGLCHRRYAADSTGPAGSCRCCSSVGYVVFLLSPCTTERPVHGKLSAYYTTSHTVVYTPNPGYTGTDIFTYKMVVGAISSALATIAIHIGDNNVQGQEIAAETRGRFPFSRQDDAVAAHAAATAGATAAAARMSEVDPSDLEQGGGGHAKKRKGGGHHRVGTAAPRSQGGASAAASASSSSSSAGVVEVEMTSVNEGRGHGPPHRSMSTSATAAPSSAPPPPRNSPRRARSTIEPPSSQPQQQQQQYQPLSTTASVADETASTSPPPPPFTASLLSATSGGRSTFTRDDKTK